MKRCAGPTRARRRDRRGRRPRELIVEVRAPGDESYEKLPFYADRGVTEVLIFNRDRTFELRRLGAEGVYEVVADGVLEVLGVTFSTVDGPKLRMEWEGGSAEV